MEMWKTHSDVMMKKEKMGLAVFSKVALLQGPAFETFFGVGILKGFWVALLWGQVFESYLWVGIITGPSFSKVFWVALLWGPAFESFF